MASVLTKNLVKAVPLSRGGDTAHTQIDYSSVRQLLPDRQFTEISIVGENDTSFPVRYCEHIPIRNARRVIDCDYRYVVPISAQRTDQAMVEILVKEELQTRDRAAVRRDRCGPGAGSTGSPATRAWAYARHACTSSIVRSG